MLTLLAAAILTLPMQPLTPVPIQRVQIDDPFWTPKLRLWRRVTIPDCLTKFENDRGGAINNFDRVTRGETGTHAGPAWYDGLVYEMITGASDYLAQRRDPSLEARLDGYIKRIAAAQAKSPDGYLNTYTQTMEPTHRWGLNGGNDVLQHDIYNAGCLIEAGVHYFKATGKAQLLSVALRMANLMANEIGPPPKQPQVPGHALAEGALVELYRLCGSRPDLQQLTGVEPHPAEYLQLSEYYIEERGHHEGRTDYGAYDQDHEPVLQQPTIEGHAVRATLMANGLAMLAAANGRPDYQSAALRLWNNMAEKKLYVTGGVGATSDGEAFGPDYDLPNDGYLETCAAVGSAFFSHSLNLTTGDARYADELERVLYNGALGHVSADGDHYSYVNPLSYDKGHTRWSWNGCPCCPPMFLKFTGALPGYIYAQGSSSIYVNLYIGNRAVTHLGQTQIALTQTTRYPWDGDVQLQVEPSRRRRFALLLRVPRWCQGSQGLYHLEGLLQSGAFKLSVNGAPYPVRIDNGYAVVDRVWRQGDELRVHMDMPIRRVTAPQVPADQGLVAFQRGPIVYAFEPGDHVALTDTLYCPPSSDPHLEGDRLRVLLRERTLSGDRDVTLDAIPYFSYGNGPPSDLRVWLPASPEKAVAPTLTTIAHPSASHCFEGDSVTAMNGSSPLISSSDTTHPRMSWWDHKGTQEWVQYDWPSPHQISKAAVYWFADRSAGGGCDLPASWTLSAKVDGRWVQVAANGGLEPDKLNEVRFPPVKTRALRIDVTLRPGCSGGIRRWVVE